MDNNYNSNNNENVPYVNNDNVVYEDYNNGYVVEEKKKSFWWLYLLGIFFSVLIGVGCTIAFYRFFPDFTSKEVTNINKLEKEVTVTDTGIADAVEKVYDSVVIVESFKGNQLYATGTGFIYKKDNGNYYVLTNYHVIQNGDSVRVVLTNGKEIASKVMGGDQFADIAVLSYQSDIELKVSEIGSSSKMRVGDTVFAIGAPLDSSVYSWSVTRGILSGKDREVKVKVTSTTTSDWIMNVLQTDAAINSGNSGGPLCNSNGQVIGITNMKLVTEGVEGMGFAIPIEDATSYGDAIINGEDISRPRLGIGMYDVDSTRYSDYYSTSKSVYGVGITKVYEASPAAQAGLQEGDIIIGMDGVDIINVATLRVQLYKHKINSKVTIKYLRNNRVETTEVTLFKYTDS